MSKRKSLALLLVVICVAIILSYMLINYNGRSQSLEENPSDSTSNPPGPVLVIPEVPLGILGSLSALAIGFGIFIIMKKK